jgi:uncharacterized Tic20 family protein
MDQNTENPNVNPNAAQGQTQTPPAPAAVMGSEIPSDQRTMAMLCHLLGLFTSFVGPLILWLIKKDEMKFVDDQGKEALNFQITVLIASIAASLLTFICIGFLLLPAIGIADIVFCILATVAANKGQAYRYPVTLRLIK